jgi:hypothetical protein
MDPQRMNADKNIFINKGGSQFSFYNKHFRLIHYNDMTCIFTLLWIQDQGKQKQKVCINIYNDMMIASYLSFVYFF